MWKDLDANRIIENCQGFFVIKPKHTPDPVPLFCAVCGCPNLSSDDMLMHRKHGCCSSCALRWVDVRREEWANGWRPSPQEIDTELKRRRARPLMLPF